MTLAPRSIKCLEGVHPDLVAVVKRADELGARFHITCGRRTVEEQRVLVDTGKSQTMKSRHLTGHAVDFVVAEPGGGISYDHHDMAECAAIFKRAAAELRVPLEWGGDWLSFVDTPHLQLPRKQYQAEAKPRSGRLGEIFPPNPNPVAPSTTSDGAFPNSGSGIRTDSTPIPAGPLKTSGTVWGSIGALLSGLGVYLDEGFAALLEVVAKMTEMAPAQAMLATLGGNAKSLSVSMLAGCIALVIGKRVRAKVEGKAG